MLRRRNLMLLTDAARDAILQVMKSRSLDPAEWFMEFKLLKNGAVGLGFTKEADEQILQFGELRLTIDGMIDTQGVILDFGLVDGKKGLLFGAEQDGMNGKPPDSHTTHECCGGTGVNCCGNTEGCLCHKS
jgi:hypothetical protein